MIITKALLDKGKSSRGAWSNKQVRLLGEPDGMINNHGWQKRVIGRYIPDVDAERFVALKDAHLKGKNRGRGKHSEQTHHGKTKAEILQFIEENQFVSYDDEDDVVAVTELKEFFGIYSKT